MAMNDYDRSEGQNVRGVKRCTADCTLHFDHEALGSAPALYILLAPFHCCNCASQCMRMQHRFSSLTLLLCNVPQVGSFPGEGPSRRALAPPAGASQVAQGSCCCLCGSIAAASLLGR